MIEPLVMLVNHHDQEIGQMNKLEVHEKGLLHRAISVLIFNSKGEWLLQKRASSKYHSPSLWTNTCCSHPIPGEKTDEAAKRRLMEEMGMNVDVQFAFDFTYRAEFANGLVEHELDHVFIGYSDQEPIPNINEVQAYDYVEQKTLFCDLKSNPGNYTEWFKILYPTIIQHL